MCTNWLDATWLFVGVRQAMNSGNDGARIIRTLLFHVLLLFKKSNPPSQTSKVIRLEASYQIKRSNVDFKLSISRRKTFIVLGLVRNVSNQSSGVKAEK